MAGLAKRTVGKNGPSVAALGFGAMGLSTAYGEVGSDEERFQVLDRALELGSTFWDSSDMYADSEDLIGKWFARTGKRDQIFLATKFAIQIGSDGTVSVRSDAAYVREACTKSLKRLGVDKIDLYYCHRVDSKVPIEETVRAMAELKSEGKIGAIGLSEISAATLRRACKVHQIAAVQVEYSPFALDIETNELLSTCREFGVTVVAYSPLGRGFLAGQIRSPADFSEGDFRKYAPRFSEKNFPKNLTLVDNLNEIAKKKGCTVGQLTLAWLLKQGEDIIPIPGTKKIKYLEENMGAVAIQLNGDEEKAIRNEVEKVKIVGDRYPGRFENYSFADTVEL